MIPEQNYVVSEQARTIGTIFCFVFSAQGIVLLPFWFRGICKSGTSTSSKHELEVKKQLIYALSCRCSKNFEKANREFDLVPSTNSALRNEIVTYLSDGIQVLKDVSSCYGLQYLFISPFC